MQPTPRPARRRDLGRSVPQLKAVPEALERLLRQAFARKRTGILLLGGLPERAERQFLLAAALRASEGFGPAALVLPAYRDHGAEHHLELLESEDGSERARSRAFPQLPLFPFVQSAYAQGFRRLVMEYECPAYRPIPEDWIRPQAPDTCLILCTNEVEATSLFTSVTIADRRALRTLVGVFTLMSLEGTTGPIAVCDGFVPSTNPVNRYQHLTASDAVFAGRQLFWEAHVLRQYKAHNITAEALRRSLCAWGVLDPANAQQMAEVASEAGLAIWLHEKALGWLRQPPRQPAPPGPGPSSSHPEATASDAVFVSTAASRHSLQ